MDDRVENNHFGRSFDDAASESLAGGDVQLVRGFTFDTASRYIQSDFGEDAWAALLDALSEDTAELVRDADINEWYPEAALRELIHAVYAQLAAGDDERFLAIGRGLALAGISRFFRMLINFASAQFVLRKVPVIWRRIRRGPAELSSEVTDDGRVLVHYTNYIYCHDPVYRLLSIANCQALVVAATKQVPRAEVLRHDRTSMTLAFSSPDVEVGSAESAS